MSQPKLKIGDYCICLDDPWTDMRHLIVEAINGPDAVLRVGELNFSPNATVKLPLNRLAYNPYRNAVARISADRDASKIEAEQAEKAILIRVAVANIARDRDLVALYKLRSSLAAVLPKLSADLIELCLRSMVASGALMVETSKKSKTGAKTAASSKIKVRVSKDMHRSEQLSAFSFSFAEELLSQSRRIGQLVVHNATAGDYREELLRALLRKSLAERYHVATGFIEGCDNQLDVIVYDRIEYAPVFREGNLVVVPMDSVRAVLEVKTRLTTQTLRDALEHLGCLPFEIQAPIFKGVFAFETAIPDSNLVQHVASFYESTDSMWGQPFDEVSAICVLNQQLVLTGYRKDPVRPVLSLVSNILGRNFQAAGFLDTMQNYLRTPAPRVLADGLTPRQLIELDASPCEYVVGMWQIIEGDIEEGAHYRALRRIARTLRWLGGQGPW